MRPSSNVNAKANVAQEEDTKVIFSSFNISIQELSKILDLYRTRIEGDDDLKEIQSLGGESGILSKLETDKQKGIASIAKREEQFGSNKVFEKPIPHFCVYVLESFKDTMLQVLMVSAVVQIVLGSTLSDQPERDWIDGVSILIAVFVVVTVGSVTNWKKEHQFKDLNDEQKKETKFGVLREGITTMMQADDILVGDIITINYGEILPADALLVSGNNVKADESSLTGESKELKKASYEDCLEKKKEESQLNQGGDTKSSVTLPSPVLLSGTNIISGSGYAVVIAVGKNSQKGQIRNMVENAQEDTQTPLGAKLETIASQIGRFGISAGVVTLIALFIRFGISYSGKQKTYNNSSSTNSLYTSYMQNRPGETKNEVLLYRTNIRLTDPRLQISGEILNIILLCVSIIVVAIPEGLPLAVTLALAFSIRKMMDKQNLVRKMHACETMGGANIICTDKTGTLTKNEMTITKIFNCQRVVDLQRLLAQGAQSKLDGEGSREGMTRNPNDDITIKDFFTESYHNILKIGLAVNIVATINDIPMKEKNGVSEEITECNKTDFAFVKFLHSLKIMINPLRRKYYPDTGTVKQIPFSSKRKRMTTLIKADEFPTGYRLFTKGGADFLLKNVTKCINPEASGATPQTKPFDHQKQTECIEQMKRFNSETLRTLSICYKDISKAEYEAFKSGQDDDPSIDKSDLVLIGIVGIKDVLRPTVPKAVNQCHQAGVSVIMVTGDNLYTAVAIGNECNILNKNTDIANKIEKEKPIEIKDDKGREDYLKEVLDQQPYAMTGNTFYSIIEGLVCETCGLEAEKECKCARTAEEAKHLQIKDVRKDRIGNIQSFKRITENLKVLARSQPVHKYSLVLGFKTLRNVVAVTGDGTNDAPALSRSDVGFAMGKAGTDIAKEASDIIILDDDFSSIVVAILWGRNIYDNIRKFLQFQLTVNFCACLLVFLCACIGNETPLIPIQMLWVNLIMDSMGSLALATESPYDELLLRKPTRRTESIINGKMWKHIVLQGLFQLGILLFLYLYAPYFVTEDDYIRLAENEIILRCYGKLPGNTNINYIIHGSSSQWPSNTILKLGMSKETCGQYAEKQDLSIAYKFYNNCNSGNVHMTMIFNVFVFYTLFNQINSRILDDGFNIFKRILTNLYFPVIFVVEVGLQVVIIFVGKTAFHTSETGLTATQWGICLGFALTTFLVSIIAKLVPIDRYIQTILDRREMKTQLKEEQIKVQKNSDSSMDKVSVSSNKITHMKQLGYSQMDKSNAQFQDLPSQILHINKRK